MMKLSRWSPIAAAVMIGLLVAACGGGAPSTATPQPPTATPRPTATTAAPTPTPLPGAAIPTPILAPAGKRGGNLQLSAVPSYYVEYDTYTTGGRAAVPVRSTMLNNLIWPDPFNQKVLVGDAAQGWEFSQGGQVLTFILRKGIKFHDGTPLTSRDLVYNLERGWHPRSPEMLAFKVPFQVITKVEAVDDYTVRLTLSAPSNYLLQSLGTPQFLMYSANIPFPEKLEDFKKNPIGSGPFKVKTQDGQTKLELVRNDGYWKPNLPYLDGVTIHGLIGPAVLAAFRTGRLDAVNLDHPFIANDTDVLVKEQGFVRYPIVPSSYGPHFAQKAPWTDARVRQAISLALDRKTIYDVWLKDKGTPYAPPLLPPEMGGQWGISTEVMKTRPGFRDAKAEDVARGKQLLAEAGVNPGSITVSFISPNQLPELAEAEEAGLRALGFKTKLELVDSATQVGRLRAGDFDIVTASIGIQVDDPLNNIAPFVTTGGSGNDGKWTDPELDRLMADQDKELDVSKRKQMLIQLQELIMKDNFTIVAVWQGAWVGHMPWVKNYPGNGPFSWSPKFRMEQVWIDR